MFKQVEKLVLASNSYGRKQVLDFANISYHIGKNLVKDAQEESFKQTVNHLNISDQVTAISNHKGLEISKKYPDVYVLSGDQACVINNELTSKPKNRAEAIGQLTSQSGITCQLITSATLCINGEVIWQHQEEPTIQFRNFSMREAEKYVDLEEASETGGVIGIAGACKIESPLAPHILKSVTGNYHTIIGLPINALINKLYELKILI
tara:strand:+ start:99968 stop:100591 length:624 start_codon:yes stop_codon:yes gene_type:complete